MNKGPHTQNRQSAQTQPGNASGCGKNTCVENGSQPNREHKEVRQEFEQFIHDDRGSGMCERRSVLALEIEHLQRFATDMWTQCEIADSKDSHTHKQ